MIIGIYGEMGSGKTLLMTYILYTLHKHGYSIMANYGLKFGNGMAQKIDIKALEKMENCAIGIDEAHIFLDSRRSMRKQNIDLSYFILQTRKRGIILTYTAQLNSSVDKRLREMADITITCVKRKEHFMYVIKRPFHDYVIKTIPKEKMEWVYPLYDTKEIVSP